jgi:hypothetical protein
MSSTSASSSSMALSGTLSSSALISNIVAPTVINPFCTINIKTHVLITLELNRPNFTRWSTFFKAMVGKFGLLPFFDLMVLVHPSNPMWTQANYAIKVWL